MLHAPPRFNVDQVPGGREAAPSYPRTPEVDSRRLLQGQREVVIRHGGACYRLRHTRNDKLILTK